MKKEDMLAVDMTDEQWFKFRFDRRLLEADDIRNGLVTETSLTGGFMVDCLLIPTEDELIEEAIKEEEFGGLLLDEVHKLGSHQKRAQRIFRGFDMGESLILSRRGLLKEVMDRVYDRPYLHPIRGYRKLS